MASNVHELRSKAADSEKITINLGYVDLGHIDLLVREGFYSNRTDFIRTAIRNQLDRHNDAVKKSVERHQLDRGLRHYSRQDLEAVQAAGEMLHIQVLGLASIANDVTPELACLVAERCWDGARWAVETYAWRFERLEAGRAEVSVGADESL